MQNSDEHDTDATEHLKVPLADLSTMTWITKRRRRNTAFYDFVNDYGHICDPNERRRLVLSDVDRFPFGSYHIRAIIVAGVGFFSDSYDIFAINIVSQLLGLVYWQQSNGEIPPAADMALKAATSAGIVIGQIAFGLLADRLGRKYMYGLELVIMIVATFAQAL